MKGVTLLCLLIPAAISMRLPAPELGVVVEAEESVYQYEPADNGAGPMWCYGSTCIVRAGRRVFVSGIETIPGAKPLNNVRWKLFERGDSGWKSIYTDENGRTREPCPLALSGESLFLSANPTLTAPDSYNGPSRPEVARFDARRPERPPEILLPQWEGAPAFTEHSYRGFCADGPRGELLLFQNIGHEAFHWSFRDRSGVWSARGRIPFPMGVEYEKPEPIRLCYPVLALRSRAAHVLAISDIIEPVQEWRAFKRQLTGREWDYDFRRLFYLWSPDVAKGRFEQPVEIASREKTAGHITNLDIWLDRTGRAHLLWLERSVWYPQMRDRFFPGTPLTTSLEYAIMENGRVAHRATLAKGGEGASSELPGYGRFHALPGGRLFVAAYFGGSASENRLLEITPSGQVGRSVVIPLQHPFTSFMTATERAGSKPSEVLDLLGESPGRPGISYARIRIRR